MPNVPDYSEQGAVLMLDELVRRAVSRGASDIHLEPKHDRLQVRLRIDGAMVEEQSVALEWSPQVNVVTLEDPVEVEIPAITQGQTHVKAGFTFANGLRAILRQDPDVILVGEMRDTETAQIALQASLTGHMVMSTLHTASTIETIVRLVDLGLEPWIVANALSAVLAQRLLRNVCAHCQEAVRLDAEVWDEDELLAPKGTKVIRPRGCTKCHGTGYRGRTGIFEVLVADDEVRELVKSKASPRDYRALLEKRKIPRLRRLAFQRVREGITTVDELLRVT